MTEESIDMPLFSGEEDEFCNWFLDAKAHAAQFGYMSAMNVQAEADPTVSEGPGVGIDQTAALERKMKAAYFLISAMPDSMVINLMVGGIASPDWPTQPKAHLMMTYLKEMYNVKIEEQDPVE
jgi:hypothetical protein